MDRAYNHYGISKNNPLGQGDNELKFLQFLKEATTASYPVAGVRVGGVDGGMQLFRVSGDGSTYTKLSLSTDGTSLVENTCL